MNFLTGRDDLLEDVVVGLLSIHLDVGQRPDVVDDVADNDLATHVFGDASHGDSEGVFIDLWEDVVQFVGVERAEVDDDECAGSGEPDHKAVFSCEVRIPRVELS